MIMPLPSPALNPTCPLSLPLFLSGLQEGPRTLLGALPPARHSLTLYLSLSLSPTLSLSVMPTLWLRRPHLGLQDRKPQSLKPQPQPKQRTLTSPPTKHYTQTLNRKHSSITLDPLTPKSKPQTLNPKP